MKQLKFLSLVALLAFASCKKEAADQLAEVPEVTAPATGASWASSSNWTNDNTLFSTTLTDSKLSSEILSKGLVVLYVKNGASVHSLPATFDNTSWYYQLSNGTITIMAQAKDQSFNKDQQFSYLIFSADELATLESKNISKEAVMNMDFAQASQLK
ncbi:MAG TPA: hypothetical protein VHK91_06260 [Flavisolibacter sp.]|jgi:hypothetical protein|nr:hypothetical protein [Flavisolibacter sp.]